MKSFKIRLTFTILILFGAQLSLKAQSNNSPDYLVLNTGDTLYGTVKYLDESGVNTTFYKKIRLINNQGKQKKYKREEVSVFRMNNDNYEGFWLRKSSQGPGLLNEQYSIVQKEGEMYFLKVLSKDKLSHYQFEWWEQGEASSMWMDLIIKEGEQTFIRATQGVLGLKKKALTNYFMDCPSLQEQINKKNLKKVSEVVLFYNTNCAP